MGERWGVWMQPPSDSGYSAGWKVELDADSKWQPMTFRTRRAAEAEIRKGRGYTWCEARRLDAEARRGGEG